MAQIKTDIVELGAIHFKPFPLRPLKNVRVARCGSVIFAVGQSGHVYTSQEDLASQRYHRPIPWPSSRSVDAILALERLEVVPEGTMHRFREERERIHQRNEANQDLEDVRRCLQRYGVDITSDQAEAFEGVGAPE